MGNMMFSDEQIAKVGALPSRFDEIEKLVREVLTNQANQMQFLNMMQSAILSEQEAQMVIAQNILDAVTVQPAAATFLIEESGTSGTQEKKAMNTPQKKHAAGVDIIVLINGTGIATITGITDANGNPVPAPAGLTVPAWSSTNPAALQVTPAADGMSAQLAGIAAGTAIVLTAQATYVDASGATQTVTGSGQPIDVNPAPAGAASAFVISESGS